MPGSGDAQASQQCVKGHSDEDDNSQKTSRDRAEQKRLKRNHNEVGQEGSTGVTTPLGT